MKALLFSICLFSTAFINAQTFTEATGQMFTGISFSSIAFADIDGDSDVDLLITGDTTNQGQSATILYSNDGTGIFTEISGTPFVSVLWSSVAFADVDNDSDLDVMICGSPSSWGQPVCKLYLNDSIGGFTEALATQFQGVSAASIAFADNDGDLDMDVVIAGNAASSWPSQPSTKLYSNNGNGIFTEVLNTPFDGLHYASIAFSDLDGDLDMDLIIAGNTMATSPGSPSYVPKLYLNDGFGVFTQQVNTPFQGIRGPSIALSDVDGDLDMDVLMAGSDSSYRPIAKLYLNDGSAGYTESTNTTFRGAKSPSIAFADVDADADMDVLVVGDTFDLSFSRLYINDGTGIFNAISDTMFPGVSYSSAEFADVDGDADMDLLLAGNDSLNQPITKLYFNDLYVVNISEHKEDLNIKIYPNPASSDLFISNTESFDYVSIYNALGEFIKTEMLEFKNASINVSSLPHGLYIIELSGENASTWRTSFYK